MSIKSPSLLSSSLPLLLVPTAARFGGSPPPPSSAGACECHAIGITGADGGGGRQCAAAAAAAVLSWLKFSVSIWPAGGVAKRLVNKRQGNAESPHTCGNLGTPKGCLTMHVQLWREMGRIVEGHFFV